MVVALMPELRGPRSRKGTLLFLSHFVAVTSWVFAMERLRSVPRDCRTSYYAGFAVPLTLLNTVIVAVVFPWALLRKLEGKDKGREER